MQCTPMYMENLHYLIFDSVCIQCNSKNRRGKIQFTFVNVFFIQSSHGTKPNRTMWWCQNTNKPATLTLLPITIVGIHSELLNIATYAWKTETFQIYQNSVIIQSDSHMYITPLNIVDSPKTHFFGQFSLKITNQPWHLSTSQINCNNFKLWNKLQC